MIEVGMVIKNYEDSELIVDSVNKGSHGLLIKGTFRGGNNYETYCPYEFHPDERTVHWYGWYQKAHLTTEVGLRLGTVGLRRGDPRDTIEEYDAEWERTEIAMRAEENS